MNLRCISCNSRKIDCFCIRSAMVNLTVDMFGHSINLLDIGGRVQGLESMLMSYMGPNFGAGKDENVPAYSSSTDVDIGKMESIKQNVCTENIYILIIVNFFIILPFR